MFATVSRVTGKYFKCLDFSTSLYPGKTFGKKEIYHRLHSPVHVASRYDVTIDQSTVNVHNVNNIFRFAVVSCINCTVKTQDMSH